MNSGERSKGEVDVYDGLPADLFEREDVSSDALFYVQPRFVNHIDEATISALTNFYRETLFEDADVLDLMSSWVSHLPRDLKLGRVAGIGMNAEELARNTQLTEHQVYDLNENTDLPFEDRMFDFVLIAVSIQYLLRPIEVFREIARTLKPGGELIIATSHRCFPTKATRAFRVLDPNQRIQWLCELLSRADRFETPRFIDRSPSNADPLWLVAAAARV